MQRIHGLTDAQVLDWEARLEAQMVTSLQAVMDKIAARIIKSAPALVAAVTTGPTGDDLPEPMDAELGIPAPQPDPLSIPPAPAGAPPGQPYISPDDLASIAPLWQEQVGSQLLPLVAEVFVDAAQVVHASMLSASTPGVRSIPLLGSLAAEQHLARAKNTYDQVGDHLWATARAQLSEGFEAGESIDQLAARLRQSAGLSARTGVLVARTSVIEASNAGSIAMARASGLKMQKEWLCVAAGTVVAAVQPLQVVERRRATGWLATLRTDAGRFLTVTPNHPVLTDRGWICAHSLHVGDNLVCHRGVKPSGVDGPAAPNGGSRPLGDDPDVQHVPAQIDQVFRALAHDGARRGVVSSTTDLYSDPVDCEVEVIAIDGDLAANVQAALGEPASDSIFTLTDAGLGDLAASGALREIRASRSERAVSDLRGHGLDLPFALHGSAFPLVAHFPGCALAPNFDSSLEQDALEGAPPVAVALAEHDERVTLDNIELDQLIDVEVHWAASGHSVYDLTTDRGWFTANGIVVHNSTPDLRTRPTHLAADGQRVDLAEKFTVGGHLADFPADPDLPPSEKFSCRCAVGYVMPDKPKPVTPPPNPGMDELPGTSRIDDLAAEQSARLQEIIDQQHADVEAVIEDVHRRFGERFGRDAGPGFDLPARGEHPPSYIRPSLRAAQTPRQLRRVWQDEVEQITGFPFVVDAMPRGISMATAREYAEGTLQMFAQFPAARMDRVHWFDDAASSSYAQVRRGGHALEFNMRYASETGRPKFLAARRRDVAGYENGGTTSWGVRNDLSGQGVVYHEFTHILDIENAREAINGSIVPLLIREAQREGITDIDDLIKRRISSYATKNYQEMVAEAGTDVMANGAAASQLSREIFGLLRAEYRRRGFEVRTAPIDDLAAEAGDVFPKAAAPRRSIAELARETPIRVTPLEGGITAKVDRLDYADGESAVQKDYLGLHPDGAHALRDAQHRVSAEVLAADVLRVVGVRAPAVARLGDDGHSLLMDFVDGVQGGETGVLKAPAKIVASAEGRRLGLADALMGHRDRGGGNWMRAPDGGIVAIDNGGAFAGVGADRAAAGNPFTSFLMGRYAEAPWKAKIELPSDIDLAQIRRGLTALKPQFDEAGFQRQFRDMLGRLDEIERRAVRVPPSLRLAPDAPIAVAPARAAAPRGATGMSVAQLRAELKAADVAIPAGARKADLVRLIEEAPPAPRGPVGVVTLAERAKTRIVKVEPLPGGKNATVELATFEDGGQAVKKTARTVEGRSAKLQQDAEEIEAKLLDAFGIRAPETVRAGPRVIFQERIPGIVADDLPRVPGSFDVAGGYYESDEGRIIGLVDALTDNYDRNAGNWILTPDGHLAGIDHGFAFQWKPGRVTEAPFSDSNPFNRHLSSQVVGHKGEWVPNDYSPADMATARQILETMRPEFERLGHRDWYDRAVERLGYIEQHATGTAVRITPRVPAPTVVRELAEAPPLSRAPLAYQARQATLREQAARPTLSDKSRRQSGANAITTQVEHVDGPPTITKDFSRLGEGPAASKRRADAEELGSLTSEAVGIRAPTVIRTGPRSVEMEHIDGQLGDEITRVGQPIEATGITETDEGRLLGLADILMGNSDRNGGNWMRLADGHLVAIDHEDAFYGAKLIGADDPFGAALVGRKGLDNAKWPKVIDINPADLAVIRTRLEALRPEFERLGRATWHRQVMARLAEVEKRADPAAAIRLAEARPDLATVKATQRAAVRTRAAEISTQRANAALIARVDELVQAKASKAVIRQELDPALREAEQLYAGADEKLAEALRTAVDSGDAAKIRAALTRQSKASKVTPIGKAGAKAKFDPATMEGVGGTAIPDGADVIVVRRGAKLAGIETPEKATVRLVGPKPLPAALARRFDAALTDEIALVSPPYRHPQALNDAYADLIPDAQTRRAADAGFRSYGGKGYEPINELLRSGRSLTGDGKYQEMVRAMDVAMDASPLPADIVTWRSTTTGRSVFGDALSSDLTGFTWDESGYMSTSVRRSGAEKAYSGKVLMRILVPRGTGAIQQSTWDWEAEMLLQRGLTLRVVADRGLTERGARLLDIEVVSKPKPLRPPSTVKTVARGDFTGLTRTSEAMGGNPGGIFEAGDGSRWYVKTAAGDAQARSEALALDLYRAAGLDAPEMVIGEGVEGLGQRQIATRFLDDAQVDLRLRMAEDPAYMREVQDGFTVDAWLGNWDVVGANPVAGWDNIVSVAGRPVRIEAGGALRFRGLGGEKAFGPDVLELDTLRDPQTARRAAQVFGDMTPEQIIASAERVRKVTPAKIKALVKKHGLDPDLADTLIARREDILRRAEALAGPKPMTVREYNAAIKVAAKRQDALDAVPYSTTERAYGPLYEPDAIDRYRLAAETNGMLRGSDADRYLVGDIHAMDRVFDDSRLTRDVELWRAPGSGRSIFGDPGTWGDDLAGFEWADAGYSSTSASKAVADRFDRDGGVRLRMLVPKGTKAIRLSDLESDGIGTSYTDEAEVLLGRGARFRVVRDRGWTTVKHPTMHRDIRVRDLDVEVTVPDETPPLPWETGATT